MHFVSTILCFDLTRDIYQIKRYSEDVIANEFKYDEDKSIVAVLPNDVKLARCKKV